jgi:hypothetical protein
VISAEQRARPITPERHRAEFLWRRPSALEEYESGWVPHRVVRKTSKYIVVEAYPWIQETSSDRRLPRRPLRTYWLDRWELEHMGVARVRSRKTIFFRTPREGSEFVDAVESLLRLGLWLPFSEEDLRKAFLRHAQEVHPDAGGNEERFIRLQEDRDRAAELLTWLDAAQTHRRPTNADR